MDAKAAFTASFDTLKKNKIVIAPFAISTVVLIILVFLYLQISGTIAVLNKAVNLAEQYYEAKSEYVFNNYNLSDTNYTVEALSFFTGRGEYREGLVDYLENNGVFDDFLELMNTRNIIFGVSLIIIGILLSIYLSCVSYAAIMLSTKKVKITYGNVTSIANKFFLRLIGVTILVAIIFILPLVLTGGAAFFLLGINRWIGLLAIIGFIVFLFYYIILMAIRLLFVYPLLFYENASIKESITKTFAMTKGSFRQLLIVFGIIYGISTLTGSIGFSPLYESFYNLFLSESFITSSILIMLILFFIVIWAVVSAFQTMFLFYSYIYFKKPRGE